MLRVLIINGVFAALALASIVLLSFAGLGAAEKAHKPDVGRATKTSGAPDDSSSHDAASPNQTKAEAGEKAKINHSTSAGEESADDKSADDDKKSADDDKPVRKTDREWKRLLSPKEYRVTRQKETEAPFSGKYVHTKKEGVYRCVCCGAKLFVSETKFDSGTGWPSFYAPLREKAITSAPDFSEGTLRVEVTCSRCDAHLGHVFGDGPEPTGLRYCINSAALKLEEKAKTGKKASRAK